MYKQKYNQQNTQKYKTKYNQNVEYNQLISEALINEEKTEYISLQRYKSELDKVYTIFNVENGIIQPSLTLNINRVLRAQYILKLFPSIVIMNADGNRIIIDCISKIMSFGSEDKIQGVIQYEYDQDLKYNVLSIFYNHIEVNSPANQNVIQTDIDIYREFDTLRVFSLILERGGIISINDGIEKILHLPLLDTQFGYIGQLPDETIYFSRLNYIRKIWPELGLTLIVKNKFIKIYSEILKYEYKNENPGIIKCHRNHGSNDILLNMTHICQKF